MFTITILDENDTVRGDDWIRPLNFTSGMDDTVHRFSTYSGKPENHCKWVKVADVLGEAWFGKTAAHICKELQRPYEFARGPMPKQCIWDWRAEKAKERRR